MPRASGAKPASRRSRVEALDRHVGARIVERRRALGLTQHRLAELIGVTYQQAHKYEKGINRISVGRLYEVARALDVEIGYFFEGIEPGPRDEELMPQRRLLLTFMRSVVAIPARRHQEAILSLTRALADPVARQRGVRGLDWLVRKSPGRSRGKRV
jgi:transcriptional regulator with XRE-family HTH domain